MMGNRSEQRAEFLGDIITTALEGGTGYWAQVSQYQYVSDGELRVCVGTAKTGAGAGEACATLHELNDAGDGYKEQGLELTLDAVAAAIGKITSGQVSVGGMTVQAVVAASRENDADEIDADYADTIAQVALLGEVVYG
jgi:hypothetical protein